MDLHLVKNMSLSELQRLRTKCLSELLRAEDRLANRGLSDTEIEDIKRIYRNFAIVDAEMNNR